MKFPHICSLSERHCSRWDKTMRFPRLLVSSTSPRRVVSGLGEGFCVSGKIARREWNVPSTQER
jgi:hypothetical protein